ncbi:oxidoreductase-like protein family [Pseudovirgaria hyperparasitica]|uniref:Oxidoreductase-like protein family n=1 Tax=Pseudovirgaria hyperparasitica TaxID=470096 RepID=A0A6A6VTW8_9PEZI|nr:oxidoreductase-like protein family [Pseudovirgaria hyperparasitica]KAF2753050.1 oxidoreductase-like protein family [Pseudovirgaria hyperparasitica]
MSIGVAIIGSGIFVKEEHLPAVNSTPSLSLKAVFSRSLKSAASLDIQDPGVDLYSEDAGEGKAYADLLARKDVSAVIIALPIVAQPDFVKQALTAGKHVLAEKPIAKDVQTAEALIAHSEGCRSGATLSIAENFRFLESLNYAAEAVRGMGEVTGFSVRKHGFVKPGTKYFETAWRKTPDYQGGFLLDGGVHTVAAIRLLLQPENQPMSVSAFSSLLQPHLPPIDSVDAVWRTGKGKHGVFSMSFGTMSKASETVIVTEQGTVSVTIGAVTVASGDDKRTVEFTHEGNGVKQEMKVWAEGMLSGKQDSRLSAYEALKDLQVLEAMFRSGENDGTPVKIQI